MVRSAAILAILIVLANCAASPMRLETRSGDVDAGRAAALEEGARRGMQRSPSARGE